MLPDQRLKARKNRKKKKKNFLSPDHLKILAFYDSKEKLKTANYHYLRTISNETGIHVKKIKRILSDLNYWALKKIQTRMPYGKRKGQFGSNLIKLTSYGKELVTLYKRLGFFKYINYQEYYKYYKKHIKKIEALTKKFGSINAYLADKDRKINIFKKLKVSHGSSPIKRLYSYLTTFDKKIYNKRNFKKEIKQKIHPLLKERLKKYGFPDFELIKFSRYPEFFIARIMETFDYYMKIWKGPKVRNYIKLFQSIINKEKFLLNRN